MAFSAASRTRTREGPARPRGVLGLLASPCFSSWSWRELERVCRCMKALPRIRMKCPPTWWSPGFWEAATADGVCNRGLGDQDSAEGCTHLHPPRTQPAIVGATHEVGRPRGLEVSASPSRLGRVRSVRPSVPAWFQCALRVSWRTAVPSSLPGVCKTHRGAPPDQTQRLSRPEKLGSIHRR